QSRKDQVPRQRRFDSNLGSLEIANLADQNDVWILSQERAKGSREIEPDLFFHLDLVDSRQIKFDRVFRRHDVCVDRIQRLQSRVKSVRLTTSRRAGDEHHAVRFRDVSLEFDERLGFETEIRHVEHQLLFIEQAKYDLLSEQRWLC